MNHLGSFFFSLFTLFSTSLCSQASTATLNGKTKDTQNLLSFKSSLPNPNILHNWQHGNDPCFFTGVFCKNSRVTSLNLSLISLNTDFSSISTHLFSIEFLTSLTLKSTNITGPLQPFSICTSSMTELDLSQNFISGSFSHLSHFSSCYGLLSLNLSYNLLESSNDFKNAHFGLFLKTLDVSGNNLFGHQVLPWVLSKGCVKLGHLALKNNKLTGSFSLSGCKNLEYLDLSSNNFSTSMPNFSDSCHSLRHLDLSLNSFHGGIGNALVGCDKLSYLNLTSNKLNGRFPSLPTSSLEFIYLGSNQFQGMIPQNSADICFTLVELDISDNHFSGMIPPGFGSCYLLETFDVSTNYFFGDFPIDMFLKMRSLRRLKLGFNHFVGTLPDSLSMLTNLETLDLSSNNITGKIPSGICQNPNGTRLKELYLQNNMFTGHIPPGIGNCSELISLDLSFNYLKGTIPTTFGSLSNLKDLIMWMNKLEGDIPSDLMYIRALEYLILDYNQLTGNIPSGLKNCTNLTWISLSSNKLSGQIPSWIGSLSNLTFLKLGNNSFFGPVPPELGDCKSLSWLDLDSNFLNGSIPPSLAKQSGNIDDGLVVDKKYVYLRNDRSEGCRGTGNLVEFSGIRPEALDRIPTSCKFTGICRGKNRQSFNHNGSMMFLDLSYNNLEGSIPKELGSMNYLLVLNLGHNHLSGPIPEELRGLKNVGVVDLSYNHLSGIIPQSLAELTLLSDIDLSNNHLTGSIPESGQFDTFPAERFYNNSGLCGYPLPRCDRNTESNAYSNASQHQMHSRQASIVDKLVMGLFFFAGVVNGFLLSVFCIFGRGKSGR